MFPSSVIWGRLGFNHCACNILFLLLDSGSTWKYEAVSRIWLWTCLHYDLAKSVISSTVFIIHR